MHQPSPARRQGLALGTTLARTVAHFFPDFPQWLGQVRDTRDQDLITYPRQFLLWTILAGYVLKLGSRRQIALELDSPAALANLSQLAQCGPPERIAHSDTLDHFLSHVPTRALEHLRQQMLQRLVRMKALDYARLDGRLLVAIDGTGQLHFRQRHCPHCLECTSAGQTHYYHNVLEAKLVTPDGLAFSLGSEFIENTDPDATKQDCELKAFRRLATRLKQDYPQLRLCFLFDSLYANGTVMDICAQHRWRYITTFKQGSLPSLWEEFQTLQKLAPENCRTHVTPDQCRQTFTWVANLVHVDDQRRAHRVHAFQCTQVDDSTTQFFAWLTNIPLGAGNIVALSNQGGRCRWKIENQGFNTQKNGGFNLEHAYSTDEPQIKNFYLLLQMAHLLLQLLERGSLLPQQAKNLFGSLANMARRLAESFRNVRIAAEALDRTAAATIQIRLNSS